jgi:hypothetical protein
MPDCSSFAVPPLSESTPLLPLLASLLALADAPVRCTRRRVRAHTHARASRRVARSCANRREAAAAAAAAEEEGEGKRRKREGESFKRGARSAWALGPVACFCPPSGPHRGSSFFVCPYRMLALARTRRFTSSSPRSTYLRRSPPPPRRAAPRRASLRPSSCSFSVSLAIRGRREREARTHAREYFAFARVSRWRVSTLDAARFDTMKTLASFAGHSNTCGYGSLCTFCISGEFVRRKGDRVFEFPLETSFRSGFRGSVASPPRILLSIW